MVDIIITFLFIGVCIFIALCMVGAFAWIILRFPQHDLADELESRHWNISDAETQEVSRLIRQLGDALRRGDSVGAEEAYKQYTKTVSSNRQEWNRRVDEYIRLREPFTDEEIAKILSEPVVRR
jgi:hypothetical protein